MTPPDTDEGRLAELERELRAIRPEIDPDFAARLDEWAASGFPPADGWPAPPWHRRLRDAAASRVARLTGPGLLPPPRRTLLALGAACTALVVAGVAITRTGGVGESGDGPDAPVTDAVPGAGGGKAASEPPGAVGAAPRPDLGAPGGEASREAGGARAEAEGFLQAAPPRPGDGFDALRRGPGQRKIARDVAMTLSTGPDRVRETADAVLGVVDAHRGLVVRSTVTSSEDAERQAGRLGAHLSLRIPAARLREAIADISRLGLVVARTDGSRDITARFTDARTRIRELQAERETLLGEIAEAADPDAIEALEGRLSQVRGELERARDELSRARVRVRLVPVSVTIVPAGDETDEEAGAGWNLPEALDDAGRVLEVALGVAVVSTAVLAPLALLAMALLLGVRAGRAVSRRRAASALD